MTRKDDFFFPERKQEPTETSVMSSFTHHKTSFTASDSPETSWFVFPQFPLLRAKEVLGSQRMRPFSLAADVHPHLPLVSPVPILVSLGWRLSAPSLVPVAFRPWSLDEPTPAGCGDPLSVSQPLAPPLTELMVANAPGW